ncbi:hypothetical protein ACTXT7_012903 [Hymenolepis weldensis]
MIDSPKYPLSPTESGIIDTILSGLGKLPLHGADGVCEGLKYKTAVMFIALLIGMLRQSDLMPVVGDDWDLYNLIIGRMLADPQYVKMTVQEIENSLQPDFVASGPDTAKKIHIQLSAVHLCERYPLFTAVHLICSRIIPANMLIPMLRNAVVNDSKKELTKGKLKREVTEQVMSGRVNLGPHAYDPEILDI